MLGSVRVPWEPVEVEAGQHSLQACLGNLSLFQSPPALRLSFYAIKHCRSLQPKMELEKGVRDSV